ncbi:hypothetical protein P6F26_16910 [Roseibacterium sp. SDUM158017]|uniref:hypothetical protein n=1 Tax=Roseicyclus salinarum TaxID=3036773 RepID=UPI0024151D75|nr:hypothetical protein [Roseibacterium sp. SDUM158017]MDG4650131.1 hypothetical protein [Roseibacterium sp. SDUM158017]
MTTRLEFFTRFLSQLAAALIVVLGVLLWINRPVHPYGNVEVLEVRREADNHLFVHARYDLTSEDCTYRQGFAFASIPGDRLPVAFEPIRTPEQDMQRVEGIQHMRVLVDMNGFTPTEVEFWTRHDCGRSDRFVDLMMWSVEVPE